MALFFGQFFPYYWGMEEKVLEALLDLQVALGELQASMADIDQAIRKLMMVQIEALESKKGRTIGITGVPPGDKKEVSSPSESAEPSILP